MNVKKSYLSGLAGRIITAAFAAFIAAAAVSCDDDSPAENGKEPNEPVSRLAYGRLFRDGNKIVGTKTNGEAVQLKGPSLQWSVAGWGSHRFFSEAAVNALIDGWNAQVIRVPLGIDYADVPQQGGSVTGGYLSEPEANWERVRTAADAAIARDVYVIVDWHSHTAHDPVETALAIDFFTNPQFAGRYGNNPAVIFEIYNEPVGNIPWATVKAYADEVIAAIREAGFNNLILVGSPYWTAAPHLALADPPVDPMDNYALAFHFYAAAHLIDENTYFPPIMTFRAALESVLDAGFPLFVSEWGTNDATDSATYNFPETDKWHAFFDEHKISSCAWGVTASDWNALDYWPARGSPLNYDVNDLANWTNPARMTPHGRYIYHWLTGRDTSWTPEPDYPEYAGARTQIELPPQADWGTYTDESNGGASTVTLTVEDGAAHVAFSLVKGEWLYDPYIGVLFGVDVSSCGYGIGYAYKGSSHVLRAQQNNDIADYAYHENNRPTNASEDWTAIDIPWGYFRQPSWGVEVPQDKARVDFLTWHAQGADGTAGEFWIKDVYCLTDENP